VSGFDTGESLRGTEFSGFLTED